MLNGVLHWVYCLPLHEAALMALTATGVFLWLRLRLENRRWWRWFLAGLLICWAGVVIRDTLLARDETRALSLIPFRCYITVLSGGERELIRSAFMNVLLFYPGGVIARSLWTRPRGLILMFLGISLMIELLQLVLGLGMCETDDLIHNTLGAALGILAVRQYEKNMQKTGSS